MSTFLQLCARLTHESGSIGTAPSAVTGQTGRQLNCVNWIIAAWTLIQNASTDWSWMQAEISATALTINTTSYTGAALGIATRFAAFKGRRETGGIRYTPWTIYDNAIGVTNENELREIPYEAWRMIYDRGSHTANRPSDYALAPDGTIRFGPKPDIAYRVRGEYRKTPQVLAADGDTPELPDRFHDIIVWRALMLIGDKDEAEQQWSRAGTKYAEMMIELQRECLPAITLANSRPLA